MPQTAIFGPFFAMLLLTALVWAYMFARRIHWIQTQGIRPEQITTPAALAEIQPPQAARPSDNLKNLFEIPVLFYAVVLYLFVVGQVDALHVGAAWVFVVFRALHSAIHCTFNHIMLRFSVYLLACLALWLMAGRAALAWLAA